MPRAAVLRAVVTGERHPSEDRGNAGCRHAGTGSYPECSGQRCRRRVLLPCRLTGRARRRLMLARAVFDRWCGQAGSSLLLRCERRHIHDSFAGISDIDATRPGRVSGSGRADGVAPWVDGQSHPEARERERFGIALDDQPGNAFGHANEQPRELRFESSGLRFGFACSVRAALSEREPLCFEKFSPRSGCPPKPRVAIRKTEQCPRRRVQALAFLEVGARLGDLPAGEQAARNSKELLGRCRVGAGFRAKEKERSEGGSDDCKARSRHNQRSL